MLRGGIPLAQSIETAAGVNGNRVIVMRLTEALNLVIDGTSLANASACTRLAPDMILRMVEVRE
jgi:type II secretory pathway component PulF